MGFVATWQDLWMLVGSGFGMVNFGLGRGQGGLISSNLGVYRHQSYVLVDQHSFKVHQVACSSTAPQRCSEPRILETALKTGTEEVLGTTNQIGIGLTRLYS